jgi:hypothetical protein
MLPKILPVKDANNPNMEYVTATPVTYIKHKLNPLSLAVVPAFIPIYPTITGISGYTQGVKLTPTPPKNALR